MASYSTVLRANIVIRSHHHAICRAGCARTHSYRMAGSVCEAFLLLHFFLNYFIPLLSLSFFAPLVRWVPYAGHCCWNGLDSSFLLLLLGRCEGPSLFDITTLIRLRSFIFILFWDEDLGWCLHMCACVCVLVCLTMFAPSWCRMLAC